MGSLIRLTKRRGYFIVLTNRLSRSAAASGNKPPKELFMKNRKLFRFSVRVLAVLLALLLPVSALGEDAGASHAEAEDAFPWTLGDYLLPIDFTPGSAPDENGYSESKDANGNAVMVYEDSTIKVTVSQATWMNTPILIADVVISDPSQLRTASMGDGDFSKGKMSQGKVVTQAKHMNAVLAINGDSAYAKEKKEFGIIFRQGKQIHARLDESGRFRMDLLLVDENGDFHGIHSAQPGDLDDPSVYEGRKIFNVFSFGPIIVENGAVVTDYRGADRGTSEGGTWMVMRSGIDATRMVIGQAGPLHYKIFTSKGKRSGSRGLTLQELAEFIVTQDVQIAYNLDGGDSTVLYFRGKQVNPDTGNARALWDIIYFASAEKR